MSSKNIHVYISVQYSSTRVPQRNTEISFVLNFHPNQFLTGLHFPAYECLIPEKAVVKMSSLATY